MDEPAPKKVYVLFNSIQFMHSFSNVDSPYVISHSAPKKVGAVKKSKAISISSDSSDDTPVVKKKVAARKK